VVLTLDTEMLTYDLEITLSGFSGEIAGAHIHAAPARANGGVIIDPLDGGKAFGMVGSLTTYSVSGEPFPPENLAS
jgi:hypothetical protein